MPEREQAMDPGLDHKRRVAALRTAAAFAAFRARLELPTTAEALLLYLTYLQASGSSGHMLQKRLQQLNAARRMEGNEAWTADPDVRLLLRGLHQAAPLTSKARGHPLYRELVMAMLDATMSPTHEQRRWRTALLLANETGASLLSLSSLQWADVHLRGDSLNVRWVGEGTYQQGYGNLVTREGAPRVVEAMRDLWAHTHDRSGAVFASRLGFCDYQNVIRRCGALPRFSRSTRTRPRLSDCDLNAVLEEAVGPTLKQMRDRALILVGHSAALRTSETATAVVGWFRADSRGLLLDIPLRREITAVSATGGAYPRSTDRASVMGCWRSRRRGRAQGMGGLLTSLSDGSTSSFRSRRARLGRQGVSGVGGPQPWVNRRVHAVSQGQVVGR